jgi:hypothetical protein
MACNAVMFTPDYVKIKSTCSNVETNSIHTHRIAIIQAYCFLRPVGRTVRRTKMYKGSHRHDEDEGRDLITLISPEHYMLFLEVSVPEVSLGQSPSQSERRVEIYLKNYTCPMPMYNSKAVHCQ